MSIIDIIYRNKKTLYKVNHNCNGLNANDINELISLDTVKKYINDGRDIYKNANGIYSTFDSLKISNRLVTDLMELFPNYSIRNTGNIFYEPGNFMGWHTNNDNEGYRIYISYCDKDKSSFFRYYDTNTQKTVDCMDDEGLNIRLFAIQKEDPLWHCVHSRCDRLSIGFFLLNNL